MKVLQLHTLYREAGGEDTVVARERSLLQAAGHEVRAHEERNPDGVSAAPALVASSYNPRAARRVGQAVAAWSPDVVHVHNTWFALSAAGPAAAAAAGAPVVATLHNYRRACVNASLFRDGAPCTECVGRSPWPGVRHRCYRGSVGASAAAALALVVDRRARLSEGIGAFLVLNAFMRDVLVRAGLPDDRVVLHANSTPDPGPRQAPPSASRTVVLLGRVEPLKGVDLLVDAWADAQPDLDLVVLGDGPLRHVLERRRVPGVRFAGRTGPDEVRDALLSARALVLPSRWYEGQPMSVLEALAAGTPVLTSAGGGLPELVAGQGPGWTVAQPTVGAWSAALRRLEQWAPEQVDAAGAAARERWHDHHRPAAALDRLLGVYRRVAR